MQGNEKLLAARAEIEAILVKHDIGAHVVLHMPGFLENFGRYDPSYSRARPVLDSDGVMTGMRIHSKLAEHYNGDVAAQKRDLEATANMLSGMGQMLANDAMSLLQVSQQVDSHLAAQHTPLRDVNPRDKGRH